MAQAMDAHSSFVYLVDNLPTWRASIEALSVHAAGKHAEFAAEYSRLVNQAKPKRRKTPSTSSIHTQDQEQGDDQTRTIKSADRLSSPDPRQINPLEAGNKYLYAQARRKRKPGPSIRSGASGPQKFRNRHHVVVYYDGSLQVQLDTMVKQIGIGRNNLRKGKAALAAARGFRLPTLTARTSHGLSVLNDIRGSMISRSTPAFLPGKSQISAPNPAASNEEASFLQVDKELEQIQALCETAAHQFLRDGDCRTELESMLQKFDALLGQAFAAAETLKKVQEESQEASRADDLDSEFSHGFADSDASLSTKPSFDHLATPRLGVGRGQVALPLGQPLDSMKPHAFHSAPDIAAPDSPAGLVSDTIEVDDASDQGSIVVDISEYRLTNTRRVRL
ncbi:uncharacterized protein Z520_02802 [Fonsecaea multimorphosa CBS 102226]|uniref:Uncharacterized protein n=1 Tax=Fonsecaea multimorphosa CBS 102226 TaxID=1442371 RepID=A0A0D2KDF1_9EURO|nr:uncharacterized protein Z520_02802 [Fonsecaea multimorphosa CBS 102226]KIY01250.1 hypothetical protein Z520_02802 [Fonsecaea multimorphosa CBS 102226]OAL28530.1 hypothetical protein AYO22_02724 [Fonsecaea multimorphosa]